MANITEVYRDLEVQFQEKKILLNYYQKNDEHKKEVDKIIHNERLNLKCEELYGGNIWNNSETLRQNIEKMDKEIGLYESLNKPRAKMR